MGIVLRTEKLSIGYKNPIIQNINLSLKSGNLVVLVGRNGSGKTTFFKTINRNIDSLDGNIFLNDKDLASLDNKELSKMFSLVLTEKPSLSGLTVETIVAMGRHPYTSFFGSLTEDDKYRIQKSIEELGIEHLKDKMINEISDGEFQKTMLARALCQDTPVILMDEPASYLDYPSKLDLLQILEETGNGQRQADHIFLT